MDINIAKLFEPIALNARAVLTFDVLAPLSLVSKAPGKHYRSQSSPTDLMILGLLENALGWHIEAAERSKIIRRLDKIHGPTSVSSGSGYASILQHHVKIGTRIEPVTAYYRDLWSQHLKGSSFTGGSREYDYRAIPIMNAVAAGRVTLNDRATAKRDETALTKFSDGDVVNISVVRPYFPQYYVSPTPREYIIPGGEYLFQILTSTTIANELMNAINDPAAPLYLGTNDGWVDARWESL